MDDAVQDLAMVANQGVRVCHVSSVHSGLDIRIAHKEAASLARAGYDVHLVINAHAAEDKVIAKGLGVHLHPFRPSKGPRMLRMVVDGLRAWLIAMQTGAKLVHFHDPELIPYAALSRLVGRVAVVDLHEDTPAQIMSKGWIPPYLRSTVSGLVSILMSVLTRFPQAIVAATPGISDPLEARGRRVVTVKNFALENELAHGVLDQSVDDFKRTRNAICYIGGISVARGISEVVEAASRTGVPLIVAGSFHSENDRNTICSHPHWKNVDYRGEVDRKEVANILSECFAGLVTLYPVPNHMNSYPIKLFEYMSAGIPVITSRLKVAERIVKTYGCGLVVGHDSPQEIADAVNYLRDQPADAREMGRRGAEAVATHFSWSGQADKLVRLYKELLRQN